MKDIIFILIFLRISFVSFGQSIAFEKYYDEQLYLKGESLLLNSDGNYLISGFSRILGENYRSDVYASLVDTEGNVIWTKKYGNSNFNISISSVESSLGNYFFAGSSHDTTGQSNILLVKADRNGDLLWVKEFNSGIRNFAQKIIETDDQFLIIVGSTQSEVDNRKAFISKYDLNGQQIWFKIVGQDNSENLALDVIQLSAGGFIISGWRKNPQTSGYLIRLDSNGNVLWEKQMSINGIEMCVDVKESKDGNLLVAGSISPGSSTTIRYPYVMKLNLNGNIIWENEFHDMGYYSWGAKSLINSNNDIFLLCNSERNSSVQLWLLKLDETGEEIYREFYGDNESNWVSSFAFLEDNFLGLLSNSGINSINQFEPTQSIYLLKIKDDNVSMLNNFSVTNNIKIFPNPCNNFLQVNLSNQSEILSFQLHDLAGKKLYKNILNKADNSFDLSELISGFYVMSFEKANGHTFSQILIKK